MTYCAKPQKLYKKQFCSFTEEWKPRDFNEEIRGIDPVSYYFSQKDPFEIPEEHERVIEEEIKP